MQEGSSYIKSEIRIWKGHEIYAYKGNEGLLKLKS